MYMIANSTGLGFKFFRRAQQGMPQKQIARSFIRSILLLEFRILEYNINENVNLFGEIRSRNGQD